MGRHRNPDLSKAVERAAELLADDPKLSRAEACRKAGKENGVTLSVPTFTYRQNHAPPAAHQPDGLPEEPTDASEIPVFERDYSKQASHRIYPIGDLHIGSPEHAGGKLAEWLQYIEDTPDTSILNTGDNTNCAIKSSVSEAYDERLTVGEAREQQTKLFKPLAEKDKIDAVIDGNHENRVYRATGDSPNAAVCQALGINYQRAICVVRYLVGDQAYEVFLRHGKGGGGTVGAQVNQLEKQERVIDVDIYVSGHTHTQVAFPKDIFVPDGEGGFTRKKRLFVCSASFLAYETYAAEAGYPPSHIGAPRIFLDGRKPDMHASV